MLSKIWNIRVKKYKCKTKPHLTAVLIYNKGTEGSKEYEVKKEYFTSQAEAKRAANALNEKANDDILTNNTLSSDAVREYKLATKIIEPCGGSLLDICNTHMQIDGLLKDKNISLNSFLEHLNKALPTYELLSLSSAIDAYTNSLNASEKSEDHIKKVKQRLSRFASSLGAETLVATLQGNSITEWLDSLKTLEYKEVKGKKVRVPSGAAISPKTRDNYIRCLSAFFNFCMKKDYIEKNPMDKVLRVSLKQAEPEIYSLSEISTLLEATEAKSTFRLYAALAVFTGIRREELHRLKWEDIHLKDREITLSSTITKTNRRRTVDISENLAAWLEPYINKKQKPSDLVLPTIAIIRTAKDKLLETQPTLRFIQNGFRHTSASYHLAYYKNAAQTSLRMGHSITVLEQNYKGLVRYNDAVKFWKIYPPEYKKPEEPTPTEKGKE